MGVSGVRGGATDRGEEVAVMKPMYLPDPDGARGLFSLVVAWVIVLAGEWWRRISNRLPHKRKAPTRGAR